VPDDQLPVLLPKIDTTSRRRAAAAQATDWINVGARSVAAGTREQTRWTPSSFSWYFLRYTDPQQRARAHSKRRLADYWMPIDQ